MGLKNGDIIIAITGATIGKVAVFNDEREIGICGDIAKIRLKDKRHISLVVSFLHSTLGQNQISKYINGSTNFHLSKKDIDRIVIPEFANQKTIDYTIELINLILEEFHRLDKMKKNIDHLRKQLYTDLIINSNTINEHQKKTQKILTLMRCINE